MSTNKIRVLILGAIVALAACETTEKQPTYWDFPTSYQMPKTETERRAECGRIRHEIARIRSIADVANTTLPPIYAANVRAKARMAIAEMDQRAAEVECRKAFTDR